MQATHDSSPQRLDSFHHCLFFSLRLFPLGVHSEIKNEPCSRQEIHHDREAATDEMKEQKLGNINSVDYKYRRKWFHFGMQSIFKKRRIQGHTLEGCGSRKPGVGHTGGETQRLL